jgi:hypothetical protein
VRKITFQDIQNKTAANEMHKIFGNNDNLKIFYQDTVANIFSEASNAMTSNAGNSLNFDNFNFS